MTKIRKVLAALPFAVAASALLACGGFVPTKSLPPRGEPSREERVQLFDQLVATIRTDHQFAPAAFARAGLDFESGLPRLREMFADASNKEELQGALVALNNSLLDIHSQADVGSTANFQTSLPVGFRTVFRDDAWEFQIERVDDQSLAVQLGDILVSYGGIAAEVLPNEYRFFDNFTDPRFRLRYLAKHLGRRRGAWNRALVGTAIDIRVRHLDGDEEDVSLRWQAPPIESASLSPDADDTPDDDIENYLVCQADEEGVGFGRGVRYGHGYVLTGVGNRLCIYTSNEVAFRAIPIVRHWSFRYGRSSSSRDPSLIRPQVRTDRGVVESALSRVQAEVGRVEGVVLDLRENGGGINPHLFIDWWTNRPYTNIGLEVRVRLDFASRSDLGEVMFSERLATEYRERAARGESSWSMPFLCGADGCDEHDVRRQPTNPVFAGPIVLLSGPLCVSSCDAMVATFSNDHLGHVIGEPPAAGHTSMRFTVPVRLESWGNIGELKMAFSRDRMGVDGPYLEGNPLPLDETILWDESNLETYDQTLIEAAQRHIAGTQ